MSGESRRNNILKALEKNSAPVSASRLAADLGVSRQVIVGDVALLRASGLEIIATARGYILAQSLSHNQYIGKLPCQHSYEQTGQELSTIVKFGGEILNVVVEHYLYGEITGQLNITTQKDVDDFLQRVENSDIRLLSELTGGVHLHTVACKDKDTFDSIQKQLKLQGLLYSGD